MNENSFNIQLTSLQLSHATVALQRHLEYLLAIEDDDSAGGEHEDYLIVQSILSAFKKAKQQANSRSA